MPVWGLPAVAPAPATQPPQAASSKKRSRAAAAAGGPPPGPVYRGVSQVRGGGRYEAHVWRDQKQIYLGGTMQPEVAALAFDLASIHLRGHGANTNLPLACFAAELSGESKVGQGMQGFVGA